MSECIRKARTVTELCGLYTIRTARRQVAGVSGLRRKKLFCGWYTQTEQRTPAVHRGAPPKAQLLLSGCYYYTCKTKKRRESMRLFLNEFTIYSLTENWSLPTEQRGHSKSAGTSSHFVPGAMPYSGAPSSSLYSQPQTSHT